ncbi:hypothetical protein Tco_1041906 [Tanacetum coccineum]|uniref:Uncharacterized protein n=1 Tax=Tanacetum coccineum TaxID=301880 RepID=A0ABQ5GHH6_9ASTR
MADFNKRLESIATSQNIMMSKIQTATAKPLHNGQNFQFLSCDLKDSSCQLYHVDGLDSGGAVFGKSKDKNGDGNHACEVFDEMPKIKKPKQEGSVQGYYDEFSSFISGMGLDESCVVSLFIWGLKPEVEKGVSLFKPKTLSDAYCLANLQEANNSFRMNQSFLCLPKFNHSKGLAENGIEEIKEACKERDKSNPLECIEGFDDQLSEIIVGGYDTQEDIQGMEKFEENSVKESGNEDVVVESVKELVDGDNRLVYDKLLASNCDQEGFSKGMNEGKKVKVTEDIKTIDVLNSESMESTKDGQVCVDKLRRYGVGLLQVKYVLLLGLHECLNCSDRCLFSQEYVLTAKTMGGYIFESKEVFDPGGKLVCDLRGFSGKNAYNKQELEANGKSQLVALVTSYVLGKDLKTENGRDYTLKNQDKKDINKVKEIRKISNLSDGGMKNGANYKVLDVGEFMDGANGSETNHVFRNNIRSLGEVYERNILTVQEKRGIVSAYGSDVCRVAISSLNCDGKVYQKGSLKGSDKVTTLCAQVANQNSSCSYVSIRKNDIGDMEIVTTCMTAAIQVSDLNENFLLLRLKDVIEKGNNIERRTSDLDEKYLKMFCRDAKESGVSIVSLNFVIWKWLKKKIVSQIHCQVKNKDWKSDILKWPKKKKTCPSKCNFEHAKWKFDIWKWPNRKKSNVSRVFCWKEGMFSSYSSACSLGYTLDIHQLVHLITHLDIHQFVHLIIVMDDKLLTLGLNETDMTLFEQYLVQYEAGIFSTKEDDQGEPEIMMSEYLHTVNFKAEPYEGCWLYISTNKGVVVFIVGRMDEQR